MSNEDLQDNDQQPVYAGGPFLVNDDSHPDVKLTDLVAQGIERNADANLNK
jgi:hypothetical protein